MKKKILCIHLKFSLVCKEGWVPVAEVCVIDDRQELPHFYMVGLHESTAPYLHNRL